MKQLAEHIAERLSVKKFCTIFENQIARIWPLRAPEIDERNAAIHAFAHAHGWTAKISDPGIRVTFRKKE